MLLPALYYKPSHASMIPLPSPELSSNEKAYFPHQQCRGPHKYFLQYLDPFDGVNSLGEISYSALEGTLLRGLAGL
jgi:hypothetical protein